MHEVKIFDGNGNLKEIIQPVFDYDCKSLGRTRTKPCQECGKTAKLLGNQKFCAQGNGQTEERGEGQGKERKACNPVRNVRRPNC